MAKHPNEAPENDYPRHADNYLSEIGRRAIKVRPKPKPNEDAVDPVLKDIARRAMAAASPSRYGNTSK